MVRRGPASCDTLADRDGDPTDSRVALTQIRDALAYVTLVGNSRDAATFGRAIAAPTDRTQFAKAKRKPPTRGVGPRPSAPSSRTPEHDNIDLLTACIAASDPADGGGRTYPASAIARESLTVF